jgi:hypothetical protein
MRRDAIGLFWEDLPPEKKAKKEKVKRQPPPRVWESPDYLPGLEEARAFNVPLFTDQELLDAAWTEGKKEPLVFDIECYPNYWQCAFMGLRSRKVINFEYSPGATVDYARLSWIVSNCLLVSFNGMNYDQYILSMAVNGCTTEQMYEATKRIIEEEIKGWQVIRSYRTKSLKLNHIDLMEVAPLFASLKVYNGRMHGKRMQDLPVKPGTVLTQDQATIVRYYCINDLTVTANLYLEIEEQIDLRTDMSKSYQIELRSKSDAQIAEKIIAAKYEKLTGREPHVPTITPGTAYRYEVPHFIKFQTPLMQRALDIVKNCWFVVSEKGSIINPAALDGLTIPMGHSTYTMGIGGLHSTEKKQVLEARNGWILRDRDVTSYYPIIIIMLGLFPEHLGREFLDIYSDIYGERVTAKGLIKKWKEAGNAERELHAKILSATLKIVLNGSYGKFGSMYSIIYSPRLIIQTTLTGQLSILMLIETLELAGISVVSANTDGFVTYSHESVQAKVDEIVNDWMKRTGFTLEDTDYTGLYSRDVNNYIALKADGKFKGKGVFADPWGARAEGEQVNPEEYFKKNPSCQICTEAVVKLLRDKQPIEKTIRECRDIRRFVHVTTVGYDKEAGVGGGVKIWEDGRIQYLGKAVRWYYSNQVTGEIIRAANGNKVGQSDGARPCMDLPEEFPDDIDYEYYIERANKYLGWLGY